MKNKKLFLFLGIVGVLLVLTGVTYAFFNYTRTGGANNLGTGRISFLSTQNNTLNLTNLFPVTEDKLNASTLDAVTITIQGDTTYAEGEEYLISLTGLNNTINGKTIPINYIAEVSSTGNIGTSDSNYFDNRETASTSIYKLNSTGQVKEGEQVLVGFIKNGATGVNGSITIKAYIDGERLVISDTLEDGDISVPGYTNKTTSEWVNGRTVLTTTEWNSFQNSPTPISFKIRAESNEGIWVEEPAGDPTMSEMCPDCVFEYSTTGFWTTWNTNSQTPSVLTSSDYSTNYEDVITASGKNFFLGLKLNGSNQIEKAYACGLYNGTMPFCIEGYSDGTKYEANKTILQDAGFWNNTCSVETYDEGTEYEHGETYCAPPTTGVVGANTHSDGYVDAGFGAGGVCYVHSDGGVGCSDGWS